MRPVPASVLWGIGMSVLVNRAAVGLPLAALLVFGAGILLARWELIPPAAGLLLYALGALLGLLSLLAAVGVVCLTQSWPRVLLALLGMLPLITVAATAAGVFRYPRINDISTDLADPPEFTHAATLQRTARDMSFPRENAALIAEAYPDVQALVLPLPADESYERALGAARRDAGWEVTHEDTVARRFEAVAVTRVFRWRDDVVVRVRPAPEGGSRIDVRSKSREGRSDLGANARRIRGFLHLLRLEEPRGQASPAPRVR